MARPEDLCMGCMEPREGSECRRCGWVEGTPPASPAYLPPRTVLDDRYLLGRVLGAGGFGITYLAWDLDLDFKLAIKEYFPNACAVRGRDSSTVLVANTQSKGAFDHGLAKFLEEGRALARFQGHPSIASVMTFFRENGTSYLVMKYEDGITLQEYLTEHGGRLKFEIVIGIAMPVMDALRAVHAEQILHRDISPDNIIINRSRQIKILDFGSAKRDMTSQDRTLQITLKRGFSPEEQYRADGKQGPWTDVYAVGATIYACLAGAKPPDALERMHEDTLQPPSRLGIKIPSASEKALMKALSVKAPARFQTIEEFQSAFKTSERPEPRWKRLIESLGLANLGAQIRQHARVIGAVAGVAILLIALMRILPAIFTVPEIREFAADPATISPGHAASLRWSVSGGSIAIAPEIGSIAGKSGTRQVTPAKTTVYTLTAKGFLRSASKSVRIAVAARPPTVSFSAEPPSIRQGASSELVWSVGSEATSVTIDQGIGKVQNSGRLKVSPTASTTYSLSAEVPGGAAAQSATTVVIEAAIPKPVIVSLAANPPIIKKGQTATLTWEVAGDNAFANFDQNIGKVQPRGSISVFPQDTTVYKLQARNGGGVVSRNVTVEVRQPDPPQIVNLKADSATIAFGQSVTLSWSVHGAVDSVNISPGIGSVSAEGARTVTPRTTTTYTISATGPGGASTLEYTVRVLTPRAPAVSIFSATPGVVAPRDTVVLRWKVDGDVENVVLDPGGIQVKPEGGKLVAPTVNTRYTLTATGPGGSRSSSVDVQVSTDPFQIVLFDAKPKKIKRGQTATLSWRVTGPVTSLAIRPDVGGLNAPSGSVEVKPDTETIYTLFAQAGTKTQKAITTISVKK